MVNLLVETKAEIIEAGWRPEDIKFIGSRDGLLTMSWEQFCIAADRDYYDGYGGQEVGSDLVIVFNDNSWLERGEYDGSEWWEYKKTPTLSDNAQNITKVVRGGVWSSLEKINSEKEEEQL